MRDGRQRGLLRISPNVNVGPDCYANSVLADSSEVLTAASSEGTGRFDASDLMPAAVGSELLDRDGRVHGGWSRLLAGILDEIEASWPQE